MGAVKSFFKSRINQVLLLIICILVIILAVVIPVLDLRRSHDNATDDSNATNATNSSNATADAARYAVIKTSFPDPCILSVNDTWYAFSSQIRTGLNVQVASATDITSWTLHEDVDALPYLPTWAKPDDAGVWAPSVTQSVDGRYLMYFTAAHYQNPDRHCIGVAVAATPMGPYLALNDPFVCNFDKGGVIDPSYFHDPVSNTSVLLFKDDGNAIGSGGACSNSNWPNSPTTFQYSFLDNAGHDSIHVGNQTQFLINGPDDGPNIESPTMWYYNYVRQNAPNVSAYHLLYNSGCYADTSYRIEHLVCWPAELRLQKTYDHPPNFRDCNWAEYKNESKYNSDLLLQTGQYPQPDGNIAYLYAPGGPDVTKDGRYMIFHADADPTWYEHREERGLRNRTRGMYIAELEYWGQDTGVKIKQLVRPPF